ncbi:MAG: DUF4968 domain-containing protein [Balneolaceae bacterium]|nr:DUF4968 domain-containing protein [Balneolaceae bacterium]
MKRILTLFILATFFVGCSSYSNRNFVDFEQTENQFSLKVDDGQYLFQFYSPEILEVNFIPNGESHIRESHAVVMDIPQTAIAEVEENQNKILIYTKDLSVEIIKDPFLITYLHEGKKVIAEKAGFERDTLETIEFSITKDEALYGTGSRALGMNRRGHRLPLYNKAQYGYSNYSEQLNYAIPVVLSSQQYLLHFDNAPIGFIDLDSNGDNILKYETISGRKTYQLVVGDDWLDIMNNYTELTGKQPMLPQWALGNFASRFGYHSQQEVLETIDQFKEDEIPVDAVIIDLFWFGKEIQYTLGNLEFYTDSFPDPDRMIRELREQDVETILITEPFVLKTSTRWEEALEQEILAVDSTGEAAEFEFYFGEGGIIDIYSEKGYEWFSDINLKLFERGVTGMWGDLGEPEAHPSYVIHETGTADEVHNIYGHDWARLVFNTFREYDDEIRPFVLMRAGYSGSQRYGLVPWSGDVSRSWDGLSSQVEIALQMSMQGLAYMHSDLGGFTPGDVDSELYTRWMQYGVFQPIYRPHADEAIPSEPVFWDDSTKALAKQAIELRYQLLPYNYTLSWENSVTGAPLMRPLFFEEPQNEMLFDYDTAYLWGDDFLIAPIINPGQETIKLYAPEAIGWFDFYTDEFLAGGSSHTVSTKKESIPTYVRAGAIIPTAKAMQSTKEYQGNELTFHYFYHADAGTTTGTVYNDDGLTFGAYEAGEYELLKVEAQAEAEKITITTSAEIGENYDPQTKKMNFVIRNVERAPIQVLYNGERVVGSWNWGTKRLSFSLDWSPTEISEIVIEL